MVPLSEEEFENIKGVIRKSNDRKQNDQMKKDKQRSTKKTTQKTKDLATCIPQKPGVNPGAAEG